MIETIILEHLKSSLSVPAYMEKPERMPRRYVLVEKTGSGNDNLVESATIAIQSYAETLYESARLNETVKAAMRSLISRDEISRVKLNTDYNYTDTSKKQYRYQAIYDVVYME